MQTLYKSLFIKRAYFCYIADATIEPLVAWLKLSFGDSSISGMVLQYKGFDGLWKCLLNSMWLLLLLFMDSCITNVFFYVGDDSLKRVLKQSLKNNAMLQMRVPREQDLLSVSFYLHNWKKVNDTHHYLLVWLYR